MKASHRNQDWEQVFKDEKLPLPPLPALLAHALKPNGPHAWSTRDTAGDATQLEGRVQEARAGVESYLELGFAGHGINSWQMYFNVVLGPLALFLQCRWGNVYDDAERARKRIQGIMGFAGRLMAEAERLDLAGQMSDGERLIVCFGDHFPSRWQWSGDGERWQQDGDFTLLAATQALRARRGQGQA